MQIEDSLDRQQKSFKNIPYQNSSNYQGSKHDMHRLYKLQLDHQMQQKNKQKQFQRNRDIAEKRQFNERANSNKQSQRLKEQAYKNYYNLLMVNQEHLKSSYVNPYSIRDNMKDQHISHSIQQGEMRLKNWEILQKQRNLQIKNSYRQQLKSQIQQRKNKQLRDRQQETRRNQAYRKYGLLPKQIENYERQRHLQQMNNYKKDLDRLKIQKQVKNRSMSEYQYLKYPMNEHNTIINPLPYNIQNPYIKKQMSRQMTTNVTNYQK